MFLHTLIEHQEHLLSRFIIAVIVVSGFLLLFGLFNKKRKKTKPDKLEFLNFDEQRKRESNNRKRKKDK